VQSVQAKPEGPRKGGPAWVPDDQRPACVLCEKPFTAINRRHHCRMCGDIFCGDCSGGVVAAVLCGALGVTAPPARRRPHSAATPWLRRARASVQEVLREGAQACAGRPRQRAEATRALAQAGEERRTSVDTREEELKDDAQFHGADHAAPEAPGQPSDSFAGIHLLHLTRPPYLLQCETLQEKKEW
jgi:hypothetical protein